MTRKISVYVSMDTFLKKIFFNILLVESVNGGPTVYIHQNGIFDILLYSSKPK
jgi:hypothetical protein